MRRNKINSEPKKSNGVIITLVAVFMLGVVVAMAALAIDVVTIYTARSEAQLAADAAALAGARVLANSGMTSTTNPAVGSAAVLLATTVANQVAGSNFVGGRYLNPGGTCPGGEVCVSISQASTSFISNPQVNVQVQRSDLPTFFARVWGHATVGVKASATAEAYNPLNVQGTVAGPGLPVAPTCVKPWLLPNMDPSSPTNPIFDVATGALAPTATNLLGWVTPPPGPGAIRLRAECTTNCAPPSSGPTVWRYYPGDPSDFPPPSSSSVACNGCTGFNNYQLSIAGCVQPPITCNSIVHVDQTPDGARDVETAEAVNGLTHSSANGGDSVDTTDLPSPPFQFIAGADDPVVQSSALGAGAKIMVSDSLVTVPVIDVSAPSWNNYPTVQIIGFVQLFLNPTGQAVVNNHVHTQVINIVGCGSGSGSATGTAILGNGASPVAVRLITP